MGYLILSPGQEHEINFGEDMVEMLPENGVVVGDREFCSSLIFGFTGVSIPYFEPIFFYFYLSFKTSSFVGTSIDSWLLMNDGASEPAV